MTIEATFSHDHDTVSIVVPTGGLSAGQIIQLPDGRAGYVEGLEALAAGDRASIRVKGQVIVPKTASVVLLDGQDVMWDHSANTATFDMPLDDKDFHLGVTVGDVEGADTEFVVDLNVKAKGIIELNESGFATAVVKTAGDPYARMQGGAWAAGFSATAEAQKMDLLSKRSFPLASNWVLEGILEIVETCDADVGDLSLGVANATHASDADAITESVFFHFDLGADLNIDAESDDGTTEVGATDTTIDFAVGTPQHFMLDGRDPSNVKLYINGIERLAATANLGNIAVATGPLKALCHLEKSANDSPGQIRLDKFQVRIAPEKWLDA